MDFNKDVRRNQLSSLEQFIKSSRENFDSILKSLKWTESEVMKEDDSMVACTINNEHKIPINSLEKHEEVCILRQEQYIDPTHLLSEPLHDKLASIYLSKKQKVDLFSDAVKNRKEFKTVWKNDDPDPKSVDRIYCAYSPDERSALYEHCVASTTGPPNPPDFNIYKPYKPTSSGAPLSEAEELARERDLKRRSFKYKKTYTSRDRDPVEVMREVINGQMELYREWLTAEEDILTEPHVDAHPLLERNESQTKELPKGPRTPEHEAPSDEAVEYNGNGRHEETDEYERRDSRHSSRSNTFKRERSRSPRRRRSSRDSHQQPPPQRRRFPSHSRSPPVRHSSSQHHNNHNDRRDRSRDKRKSYTSSTSRHSGSDRRREKSRSRSPRRNRR